MTLTIAIIIMKIRIVVRKKSNEDNNNNNNLFNLVFFFQSINFQKQNRSIKV